MYTNCCIECRLCSRNGLPQIQRTFVNEYSCEVPSLLICVHYGKGSKCHLSDSAVPSSEAFSKPHCVALWHLAKCDWNEGQRALLCHMCTIADWQCPRRRAKRLGDNCLEELNFSQWTSLKGWQQRRRQKETTLPAGLLSLVSSSQFWFVDCLTVPANTSVRPSTRSATVSIVCQCECPLVLQRWPSLLRRSQELPPFCVVSWQLLSCYDARLLKVLWQFAGDI